MSDIVPQINAAIASWWARLAEENCPEFLTASNERDEWLHALFCDVSSPVVVEFAALRAELAALRPLAEAAARYRAAVTEFKRLVAAVPEGATQIPRPQALELRRAAAAKGNAREELERAALAAGGGEGEAGG